MGTTQFDNMQVNSADIGFGFLNEEVSAAIATITAIDIADSSESLDNIRDDIQRVYRYGDVKNRLGR